MIDNAGTRDGSVYPDWCVAEKGQVYRAIFAQIMDFDKNVSKVINEGTLKGLRQYTGRGVASLHANGYMSDVDINGQLNISPSVTKVQFNLTAAVIDTLTAKLASIQAVPQAVTFKGSAKGRQLAEDLNFIVKGLFHKYNVSHMINLAYRDAMINRAGYIKIIKDEGEISFDRLMVDEIVVDPADGYYDNPYKIIHRKAIPRHVLLLKYPQFKKEILDAQIQEMRQYNTKNYTPCLVVAEAWCKNSYLKTGRHTISIETVDILDEEWDKDYFPIIKCDYNPPAIGWLGQSVVDELNPIQQEIDRILATMQAIMKVISVPRVLIDTNAQVNKNHFTNKVGVMIEYDAKQGVAPIIHNGAGMPPELPAQLQTLIEQGYARVGLTPMDTQGMQKTGSGNSSGEALKTMTDIKSERWQLLQQIFENTHVQVADILLRELQGTSMKLHATDRYIGLKEINTKKIPAVHDSYVLKIFPVSSLPDSIPDLIDSVTQMLQLGVIQASQVPELFKMPDLDAYVSMQSAPRKLIDKKIEEMMDGGKYWNPEPYHDLDYALGCALQHYSWAQLNDEKEKPLILLRRFINDVKSLKAQAMPPAPAPQPPTAQGVQNAGSQTAPVPGNPTTGQPTS